MRCEGFGGNDRWIVDDRRAHTAWHVVMCKPRRVSMPRSSWRHARCGMTRASAMLVGDSACWRSMYASQCGNLRPEAHSRHTPRGWAAVVGRVCYGPTTNEGKHVAAKYEACRRPWPCARQFARCGKHSAACASLGMLERER